MILRDLIDVKAICEAGSFRKASLLRGVTQPTLSNRIAHLEDQLGTPLFERGRGQSEPTALARFIAARARDLANDAEMLGREVERLATGQEGTVRIGCAPGPMRALAGGIVDAVSEALPRVALELVAGSTARLGGWLTSREIDIAICPTIEAEAPQVETVACAEAPIVVVASPGHQIFAGPAPTIAELLNTYPIALPPTEERYLQLVRHHFGIALDELPGRLMCSDYELLVRIVASGTRYFTAGPAFAFATDVAAGRLKLLDAALPFGHVVAVQINRDAHPFPAVGRVRDIVAGLLPQLYVIEHRRPQRPGP